jgi:hypothetical protein
LVVPESGSVAIVEVLGVLDDLSETIIRPEFSELEDPRYPFRIQNALERLSRQEREELRRNYRRSGNFDGEKARIVNCFVERFLEVLLFRRLITKRERQRKPITATVITPPDSECSNSKSEPSRTTSCTLYFLGLGA